MYQQLHTEILETLLNPEFLTRFKLEENYIQNTFSQFTFKNDIKNLISNNDYNSSSIFQICASHLNKLYFEENSDIWLKTIYNIALFKSFPTAAVMNVEVGSQALHSACHIYLEILKIFARHEKRTLNNSFYNRYPLEFLTDEEIEELEHKEEYLMFLKAFKEEYIYEMMKLNQEILGYNTLDHICGVHHLALSIGRQLKAIGVPIDLGRVSGSCAGHDIGKFGCRKTESSRVPYLHYYYTDEWFKKHNILYIGHIALNHSVWDLELENLSLESLILIYCDFRVKNIYKNNSLSMNIFSLEDSFRVILEKLDNLDDFKTKRYKRVYSKLCDFQEYLLDLGVDLSPDAALNGFSTLKKDTHYALLFGDNIVATLKNLSFKHSILLMNKLRDEFSLNRILELARTENNGENIREYLQLFYEYSTYLTQKQKIIMLKFLYEFLTHDEEDIRKQCAELMGALIATFDERYRKDIPEDITLNPPEITSDYLLVEYLNLLIYPDHKVADFHRKWVGYSLKIMISSLFTYCDKEHEKLYKAIVLDYYKLPAYQDASTILYLLNAAKHIPISNDSSDTTLHLFIIGILNTTNDNLRISALDTCYSIISKTNKPSIFIDNLKIHFKSDRRIKTITAEKYLYQLITQKLNISNDITITMNEFYSAAYSSMSNIFLSNLKTLTPWTMKNANIELLLNLNIQNTTNTFYTAIHFCNLLKVSAVESVRNSAGEALITILPLLSFEQRNDIAIELIRSLEIEGYQFSKYIPFYLGKIILYLEPIELDETINEFILKIKKSSNQTTSLILQTIGIAIENYPTYKNMFLETPQKHTARLKKLLGILLNGLAHFDSKINQISFRIIGKDIFDSKILSLDEKSIIFKFTCKKILTLLDSIHEKDIILLTNSAVLNHIYRFISDYTFFIEPLDISVPQQIAFFPGTFDPFSLSHKEIAKEIQALGFEVYLAVDEFSWSKSAQPNLFRKNIINLSIADELNIHMFPENIPINISNPSNLELLRNYFINSQVYIVIGSDVILNASAYKTQKETHSIHTFAHIVFERKSFESSSSPSEGLDNAISALPKSTIVLNLPPQFEDISSTQIRDFIDDNRDISSLIDPLSQKYIYDMGLYQREPQYKSLMKTNNIHISILENPDENFILRLLKYFYKIKGFDFASHVEFFKAKKAKFLIISSDLEKNKMIGFCAFHSINTASLYNEFCNSEISEYIRQGTVGRTIIIDGVCWHKNSKVDNLEQIILTETLSFCIKKTYTYAIFKNNISHKYSFTLTESLKLFGFKKLPMSKDIYMVNMTSPCILNFDIDTMIKPPYNENSNIKKAIFSSRKKLQKAISKLYPGNLLLPFDRDVLYQKLINKICEENRVSNIPTNPRVLGNNVCVPFGNILKGIVVPNTITKSLHTEKLFLPDMKDFLIRSYPYYLDLESQARTISSFNKPIILVDDLLNKGYRIKALDPILKSQNVNVKKIIVGILTGRGKELMDIQNREVDCSYFIPNLKVWFQENALYPFMGGDSVWRGTDPERNLLPSINLLLPYTSPSFIKDVSKESLYNLSTICLENALSIMTVLEKEYEQLNHRNLTLNHLGEVFISPRYPDKGTHMHYNLTINPSHYIRNDIELLRRMENIVTN